MSFFKYGTSGGVTMAPMPAPNILVFYSGRVFDPLPRFHGEPLGGGASAHHQGRQPDVEEQ
jgi:hypothetical protein